MSEIFLDFNNESHNWVDKKTHNIFPSIKVGTLWEIKVPAGNKYHLPPDLKERGHDLGKIEGRIWTPAPLPFQASSRLYMGNLPVYHILFSGGIELSGHGILDHLEIRVPLINLPDQIFNIKTYPLAKIHGADNDEDLIINYRFKDVPIYGKIEYQLVYDFVPKIFPLPSYWGKVDQIPYLLKQKYTQMLRNWYLPEKMQTHLTTLFNPIIHEDISIIYRELYTFVRLMIKPVNQDIRKGTRELFRQEKIVGDCDEYTDLFIACARFLGLPARRITGFYYEPNYKSQLGNGEPLNKEIERHAWAEVYAPALEHWVTIDVAQFYFGLSSIHHLPIKLEGTSDSRQDMKVYTKHTKVKNFHYESYFNDPKIEIISNPDT